LSIPSAPVIVGVSSTGGSPSSVAVAGRYAYLVDRLGGTLQVINVSIPTAPVSAGSPFSLGGGSSPYSVAVSGRYAYVANYGSNTLQVIDVSNPANPVSVGLAGTGSHPRSVAVAGRYAYVANATGNTLQIFDVSTPANPVSLGSVATGSGPQSLAVAGRYAYVANFYANTLQIFDLGGAYLQQLEVGALETGTLQTRDTATVGNNLDVRGGLTVSASARISGGLSVDNGTIAGDGSGLINLNAGNLTGTAGNFSAANITFTGSITGNGAGLTGVTATTVATPPGMALIPAGAFTMGDSLDGESDATTISATVSAFYMDVNLVSYSQWQSVYYWATSHGYGFVNAGSGKAANHPVQTVDWYDCVKWCNARSQQAAKTPVYYTDAGLTQVYTNGDNGTTVYANWTASGYRLPTEAEWEKAARGGLSGQRFPWGNVITENLANYYGNTTTSYDLGPNGYNSIGSIGGTSPATSPVGSFAANGYGLYDMAGNVYEWCWDWYGTPYAGGSDPHGPAGPLGNRVLRGGDWSDLASLTRCANRNYNGPGGTGYGAVGFRCVRGL
jgi:YVTN family beta-propeller protein